jgi:hypothetical protein
MIMNKNNSRYDDLFETYQEFLETKKGTKYEMLAALVFKLLDKKNTVIHDLRLIGESGTRSQIDVQIEECGIKRKILIECKDYDISGDSVGIKIIRKFRSVMEDIKPDEGIVITCNGFTRDAKKYAKHYGIKLAVLREFREEDKEGRILAFDVHITMKSWTNPRPFIGFRKEQDLIKWQSDLSNAGIEPDEVFRTDKIIIKVSQGSFILNEFMDDVLNGYPKETAGHVKYNIPVDGGSIEIDGRGEIPIGGLTIDFDIIHKDFFHEMVSDKVATLILEPLGVNDDIVFCGEDIERYKIDPESGEVKHRE